MPPSPPCRIRAPQSRSWAEGSPRTLRTGPSSSMSPTSPAGVVTGVIVGKHGGPMATLRIEHAITDYATWKGAFDRAAPFRAQAGVRGYRIQRPVDEPNYLLIDLEFDDAASADSFRTFLRENIWTSPEASPALDGLPQARVVDTVEQS